LLDIDDWPLPRSLTIDQTLRDLTEHAGLYIDEEGFDQTCAGSPQLILPWIAAAGRYATTDYQMHLLHRPIDWMRHELAPTSDQETGQLATYADNLRRLLGQHKELTEAQAAVHREFLHACAQLQANGLLQADDRQWQEIPLIAHGLTEPTAVSVPDNARAPWLLVKAGPRLMNALVDLRSEPEPGAPVLRGAQTGIVRVDHDGTTAWLLPDTTQQYWLHGFAWTDPRPCAPHPETEER
jgi:hypothetical protein